MDARLPAHLEVSALIRQVNAEGGFAAVLAKGERDAGTILVVLAHNGAASRLFERMPELDGTRPWRCSRTQDSQDPFAFQDYLDRRKAQDPDMWIVELDVAKGERFIGGEAEQG
ncbi:DUF1491 family protein [Novosphingobium sp. P6W]|uniref:DUF1491 family protein n=1 Tax=Novosphingobium sp. P6W TaxID=1609758 RepID=UPI0005C2A546|nr:DUF1491 family protein [Novosphingobium sp. P6W]AXB75195.1 DUF1491 family protein [Novosphingobium sp. P6W]KIS32750.1 hypothetical protein TQ38_10745 [Novosphingobium sp. P6W]